MVLCVCTLSKILIPQINQLSRGIKVHKIPKNYSKNKILNNEYLCYTCCNTHNTEFKSKSFLLACHALSYAKTVETASSQPSHFLLWQPESDIKLRFSLHANTFCDFLSLPLTAESSTHVDHKCHIVNFKSKALVLTFGLSMWSGFQFK